MNNQVAAFISKLLHPIFMPLIAVILLFLFPTFVKFRTHDVLKVIIIAVIAVNTIVMPLIFSLIMKRKGVINSLYMETVEERRWPYLFSIFLFTITIWLFLEWRINPVLIQFLIGATASILILLIATYFRFKMSAHLLGIGGLVGVITVVTIKDYIDLSGLLIAIILLSGILGTARLQLKAHRPVEIYSGFLVGLILQLIYL